jgi:Ca2+-binding EF-hand superfamily protein
MLSDIQERKATHYFGLIDEDGNGLIEASDFALRAQRLAAARTLTEPGAEEALRQRVVAWWDHIESIADLDGDARVTISEWMAYWAAVQRGVDRGDDTLASLHRAARETLRALDRTGSGRATPEEYADWLSAWGADGHREAFAALDRGGKGFLTEADVIVAVQEFYLSDDPEAPGTLLYGPLTDREGPPA